MPLQVRGAPEALEGFTGTTTDQTTTGEPAAHAGGACSTAGGGWRLCSTLLQVLLTHPTLFQPPTPGKDVYHDAQEELPPVSEQDAGGVAAEPEWADLRTQPEEVQLNAAGLFTQLQEQEALAAPEAAAVPAAEVALPPTQVVEQPGAAAGAAEQVGPAKHWGRTRMLPWQVLCRRRHAEGARSCLAF